MRMVWSLWWDVVGSSTLSEGYQPDHSLFVRGVPSRPRHFGMHVATKRVTTRKEQDQRGAFCQKDRYCGTCCVVGIVGSIPTKPWPFGVGGTNQTMAFTWLGSHYNEGRKTEQQRLVQTALERKQKDRAKMFRLDRHKKKDERQSSNDWFRPL